MSRFYVDDGIQRLRLTNTRINAVELANLKDKLEAAFQDVQNELDAGPGEGGPIIFNFAASNMWVVNHNMGRAVSVDVLNAGGARIGAEVLNFSDNQVRVYFDVPVPGRVLIR